LPEKQTDANKDALSKLQKYTEKLKTPFEKSGIAELMKKNNGLPYGT
jgi:hypothetical protein